MLHALVCLQMQKQRVVGISSQSQNALSDMYEFQSIPKPESDTQSKEVDFYEWKRSRLGKVNRKDKFEVKRGFRPPEVLTFLFFCQSDREYISFYLKQFFDYHCSFRILILSCG